LGNPVAFAVVSLLAEHKEMNPSEIARAVGPSVSRTSNVLAALRLAEIVR
jgi:DNA-binding transcriptional ArsR family regulator